MTTYHTKKKKMTKKWEYCHPTKTPIYAQIKNQQMKEAA